MKILRLPHINRKVSLLALTVLLIAGLGYVTWYVLRSKPAVANKLDAKYVSLDSGYLFSIPAKYIPSETAIPGVTIVYPDSSPPRAGQNLEELYGSNIIAVQPIAALKDNNINAFKEYVNNILATNLRESLHSATDIRESLQNGTQVIKVYVQTNDGKRLKVIYTINLSQPIMIVAKDESDALKIIGSTIEDLKKSQQKVNIDQATQTTKEIIGLLQKQDVTNIRKKATSDFNENPTKDQLSAKLKQVSGSLDKSITIVGGSYDGSDFIAQLIFRAKAKDEQLTAGVVSLQKIGRTWRLDGLELPE